MTKLTKNILYSISIILLNIYPCSSTPDQKTDSLLKIIKTTKADTTLIQLAKGSWQLAN